MIWSPILALLALPCALAASKDPIQQQLVELAAAGKGVIKLDANTFDLLTSPKRTWSASVQLTALDKRRKCAPCNEFNPSWNIVAGSWTQAPKEHRDNHFFATLDFDDGSTVFQKLGLTSAPVVYVYPPAAGSRQPANGKTAPSKYDFSNGFEPEPLASSMSHHTPIPIPYKAPINYTRYVTMIVGALGIALTLRFVSPILHSRWTWAVGTISTSLIMTGGYMFTRIRNVPYTGGDGQWIAPGYQNQYGQEVWVVAGIYGTLSFAFLMLILIIPYQSSPTRQRFQVYLWTGLIMLIYSVLVVLFKVKNRGYPFKLFL